MKLQYHLLLYLSVAVICSGVGYIWFLSQIQESDNELRKVRLTALESGSYELDSFTEPTNAPKQAVKAARPAKPLAATEKASLLTPEAGQPTLEQEGDRLLEETTRIYQDSLSGGPPGDWVLNPALLARLIRVSIREQKLYFYVSGLLEQVFSCSTSRGKITPLFKNPVEGHDHVGVFQILDKFLELHDYMPHALRYNRKHYIHGTDEEELIGTPASDGCVRLYKRDAAWLYGPTKKRDYIEIRY